MKRSLLALVFIFGGRAHAKEMISWDKCLADAKANNAQLRSAAASVDVARYNERSAFGGYLPQISANLGVTESGADGAESTTNYSAGVSITQNLFAGFETSGKYKQSQAAREGSEADAKITEAFVLYNLKTAFHSLSYAQEFRKLTEDIVKRRTDNLRLVELRFESGRENKGSVLLSRAYLAEARYDDLQAANLKVSSRAQLAQGMGRDLEADTEVVGRVPLKDPGATPDFLSLVPQTSLHKKSVADENVALAGITIAKSNFFPDLNLTGGVGRAGPNFFPETGSWNVGLTLSIPLFAGGQNYYGYRSASSNWVSAFSKRVNVDRELLTRLTQTYSNFVETVERFRVNAAFREAALLRAEIARNKYNNGLMSFDDWDVIENDLINRQKGYLSSERDRVNAEAAWELALEGVSP